MNDYSKEDDAFGEMLLAHMKVNKSVFYVIERDDGLVDVDSSLGYFTPYEEWPKEEQSIIEYVQSPVLDLGCGAGRHSLYLQKKGFDVVAMDISQGALEVTKSRGIKRVLHGNILAMPSFDRNFGSFLIMGNNLALYGIPQNAITGLHRLGELALPDATLIAHFRDPSPDNPNLESVHREYHEKNRKKGLPVGHVQIRIRYRILKSEWFPFYMPTLNEFKEIIIKSDFWEIEKIITKDRFIFTVLKKI